MHYRQAHNPTNSWPPKNFNSSGSHYNLKNFKKLGYVVIWSLFPEFIQEINILYCFKNNMCGKENNLKHQLCFMKTAKGFFQKIEKLFLMCLRDHFSTTHKLCSIYCFGFSYSRWMIFVINIPRKIFFSINLFL